MILRWFWRIHRKGNFFSFLNVYGPFHDRRPFWEDLLSDDVMDSQNMIIGGDFNLTLSEREIWGILARHDALRNFFSSLFQSEGLVDVIPCKLEPTWRNKRRGDAAISKCLDRFLVSENLMEGYFLI